MPPRRAVFPQVEGRRQQGGGAGHLGHAVGLMEADVRRGGDDPVQSALGDGGRAVDDAPQAPEPFRREARTVQQHLDHGRHQKNVCHAVLADGLQGGFRIEAGKNDDRATGQQHGGHGSTGGEVEQGRDDQAGAAVREQAGLAQGQTVADNAAVAEHHAL